MQTFLTQMQLILDSEQLMEKTPVGYFGLDRTCYKRL